MTLTINGKTYEAGELVAYVEKLEKEAEKYFKSICEDYNEEYERTGKRHYWVGFDIKNAFLAGAEPREKRIAELEAEVKEWKDKADLWCRTANLKDHNIMINKELEKHNEELIALINAERKRQEQCDDIHLRKIAELEKENAELKEKYEKLLNFATERTECCDVCPITDTCINSEGTCPYAGILAKGEEEVTREWLMQFVSKEIKEND